MHGFGRMAMLNPEDKQPTVTRALLRRVMAYARPYWKQIAGMLLLILFTSGLSLVSPLIFREMIDKILPAGDLPRLMLLAAMLFLVPVLCGAAGVLQRRLNAAVGEGVIYDLRIALFEKLQRMSLRFFTNTKVGELMSRLNNDVVGAQNAISNTLVNIVTNAVQAAVVLGVMLSLEWRLTLVSVLILPFSILVSRRLSGSLRETARRQMETNARMNAHMNETLNISGALLVKLFGRAADETRRFRERAAGVRDLGIRRAVIGALFFISMGIVTAVGTALVYGFGGYLVILKSLTVGTIVAFGSYLGSLYGALQGLANAPVEFSTSVVSFERVFEVLDLPLDISEKKGAPPLRRVKGELVFENVSFRYSTVEHGLLLGVKRFGMDSVTTVFSTLAVRNPASRERTGGAGNGDGSQARGMVLEDISFRAAPGKLIALVGPSGAGKTTLTYLIPRLYDPIAGRILLDGRDLRDMRLAPLGRDRHGHPGSLPVPRHHPHQPHLRQAGRRPDRDRAGGPGGEHPRLHRGPAGRLRHDRRGARLPALGRREAAHRAGAGDPQGSAHPRSGRSHQQPRQRIRGADPGGAQARHGRADQHRHRPPPEHDPLGRPDPGDGPRPDRRTRDARRAVWKRAGCLRSGGGSSQSMRGTRRAGIRPIDDRHRTFLFFGVICPIILF